MNCRVYPAAERPQTPTVETVEGSRHDGVAVRLANKFGPVVKVMRFFGMYAGATNFKRLPACRAPGSYEALYCCFTTTAQWTLFLTSTASLFYEDTSTLIKLLHLLQCCLWLAVCAASATVALYVLPVGRKNPSRFEKFLRNIVTNHSNVNFPLKSTMKFVLIATVVLISNIICAAILTALDDQAGVIFEPWKSSPGGKVICLFLLLFSNAAWLYPFILITSMCSVLVEAFDDFERRAIRALEERTLDVRELRIEHRKLCETVELADKTLAPLLLVKLGGHVPLLTLIFYKLVTFPRLTSDTLTIFLASLIWCAAGSTIILALLVQASRVNDKVSS